SLALVILLTALPVGATAQTVTVSGRVLDATSADPVARATVSVESRFTITDDDGTFVLAGIESGSQVLTIHAFGYDTIRTELVLSRDTVVEVALTPVPVRLDPVHGAARTVVLRGVVRDPGSDRIVRYVAVLADGGRSARSD